MNIPQQHGLGPTRARVLTLLQRAVEPVSVGEAAQMLDVHRNSARFHLDALVEAGHAERAVTESRAQGRPPLVYSATSAAPTMDNVHLLELIDVLLAGVLARTPDAEAVGEQAGRRWGAGLAEPGTPAGQVVGELVGHLAERGFGVERDGDDLRFTRCPFRGAVAPERMPLVCAIHQGLLDGYLEVSAGGLRSSRLANGPQVCIARLARNRGTPAGPEA